jgi:hypothetical protein
MDGPLRHRWWASNGHGAVDPIVVGSLLPANPDRTGFAITIWAAISVGLATVTVRKDPTAAPDVTIAIVVESWPVIALTLRLECAGDPEDRYPATLTAGAQADRGYGI